MYELLRDRVPVSIRKPDGSRETERLTVIDWDDPDNNDFLLVSQLWIKSDLYERRTDLLGFVNGIPLVFIELKAAHRNLKHAYDDNLRDYRDTIPHIFMPNGFIVLSNGAETKVGTITSAWEHFLEWKKINSEGEEGRVSLETVIRGMCTPERLLDIVGNFTVFQELPGGLVKLVARNHQYLGVNNALARLQEVRTAAEPTVEPGLQLADEPAPPPAKLGVFWHTQGSGKTVSMIFFTQKVLRTMPGNWTFVIVTDRDDLDEQAYKEFAAAGIVEEHTRATSSRAPADSCSREDRRYVFTLIQKFRTEHGEQHPVLSDRRRRHRHHREAHRTQYDVLALNMRNALPNAGFLGFTGTPLIAGEEKTKEVFGDYVSIYNYASSTADGATVPLYFENRIPTLQLDESDASTRTSTDIVEDADLDPEQERKLARLLGQQYELITREDRLERVAQGHRRPLSRARLSGQGDGGLDRQGDRRPHLSTRCSAPGRRDSKRSEERLASRRARRRRARPPRPGDRLHARHRHGRRDLSVAERGRRDGRARDRHPAASASGWSRRTWRASSRTPRTRSASRSSARCGRPGSTCRRARRSISTSRCATRP